MGMQQGMCQVHDTTHTDVRQSHADGVRIITVDAAATSAEVAAGIGLYATMLGAGCIAVGGLLAEQKVP
jgi:alpha-D-ribose 1-methylphosphonate 5-triphosphate diphosphatase PhnM